MSDHIPSGLPENMLSKITAVECPVPDLDGMCWRWDGCLNSKGYGCVGVGNKRTQLTHRVSYELHWGPIPAGLQIDHLCRNKQCCNPHHLEVVTGAVNRERAAAAIIRCKHDHPLAGPNVRIKTKGKAGGKQRQCRVCEMDIAERYNERTNLSGRTSLLKAARRACRREWLLEAGEAALAGQPIPTEPTDEEIEVVRWNLEDELAEQALAEEYRDDPFVRSWLGIAPAEGERNLTFEEMLAHPTYPGFMARLNALGAAVLGEAS